MTDYKLYFLGRGGAFERREDLACEDDAHAIRHAVKVYDGTPMELWCGARLVRKFDGVGGGGR